MITAIGLRTGFPTLFNEDAYLTIVKLP